MAVRETSTRDAALLRALDGRGVLLRGRPVSADQLRRWRTWRRVGFIPRSPERIRGYRPGVEIPSDEVRWVADAAELVPHCNTLDDVAWWLTRYGWPVDAEGLRTVIVAAAEPLLAPLEDESERADLIVAAVTRHSRGRSGGRREHVLDVVADLAKPGRIAKAMRKVWIASAADIVEAVRWSATPLEALDLLAGFLPPSVLERQLVAAGYLAPMSTRAQEREVLVTPQPTQ